jgi:hypothetical protein
MEIGHSANAPAVRASKPCKAFASQALFHGEPRRREAPARPINHSESFRHACGGIGARPAGYLKLHSPCYCSVEQFFRIFDSLPQGFGLFLQRHPAHRGVLQIPDAVVAEGGKRSIVKRTSAADMLDKPGCKILKCERDHARLSSAAVRILEDLFIIHRVSSPVCARGGRRAGCCLLPSVSVFRRRFYRPSRIDRGASKITNLSLRASHPAISGKPGGGLMARLAGGSSRSDRRKMGPGAGRHFAFLDTRRLLAGHQPPYACTGDSRGCNC